LEGIKKVFATHPKLSNACTGFFTFSLGDVISQKLERDGRKAVDVKRSLKIGALGFVMNGLFLHSWFVFLDKKVGTCMVSKSSVICKVIADQLIYAPFAIVAFFSYSFATGVQCESEAGKKVGELQPCGSVVAKTESTFADKLGQIFWPTFAADCTVWPLANVVNFRYVPLMYRASFTAMVSLLWQTYLSAITHSATDDDERLSPSVASV